MFAVRLGPRSGAVLFFSVCGFECRLKSQRKRLVLPVISRAQRFVLFAAVFTYSLPSFHISLREICLCLEAISFLIWSWLCVKASPRFQRRPFLFCCPCVRTAPSPFVVFVLRIRFFSLGVLFVLARSVFRAVIAQGKFLLLLDSRANRIP
jgi:hypothetical protein